MKYIVTHSNLKMILKNVIFNIDGGIAANFKIIFSSQSVCASHEINNLLLIEK